MPWSSLRANGGVQPPRARPRNTVKKRTISRAQRSAGTMCSVTRSPALACHPHGPTTPAPYHTIHNGRSVGITSSTGSRSAQRASNGTTLLWNHLARNVLPAEQASVPRRHNALPAPRACVRLPAQRAPARRETGTTCLHEARFATSISKKERQSRCHGGRTVWHSAAASALQQACQNVNDLAREAVSCNAVFGAPVSILRARVACADHIGTEPRRHNGP